MVVSSCFKMSSPLLLLILYQFAPSCMISFGFPDKLAIFATVVTFPLLIDMSDGGFHIRILQADVRPFVIT